MATSSAQQGFHPTDTRSGTTRVLDPYLLWAQLTDYRYLGLSRPGRLRVAQASGQAAFATATVDVRSPVALAALQKRADFVLAEPGMWPVDRPPRKAVRRSAVSRDPVDPACDDRRVVIGVIDGRCGFANRSFCEPDEPAESMIDAFWDQGQDAAWPWCTPADFGYGRELRRAQLDEALRQHVVPAGAARRAEGERALYLALGQALPADADWSHGTHVLDTVLGDYRARQAGAAKGPRPGVVYVQLPDEALRDTSARWTAANVLDALHYILRRAGNATRVIVNLSLGAFAGPHDGSSLLERAMDDLIEQQGGRLSVVVAAGNTGLIRDDATGRTMSCHARVTLGAALGRACEQRMQSAELHWDIDGADSTESFMEIWLPQRSPDGGALALDVLLSHEDGASVQAAAGTIGTLVSGDKVVAALFNASGDFQVPNGRGGMVLVALGHTRDERHACARTGRWTVTVTNASPWPVTLDACIERRDLPGELAGYRPQYGFGANTPGRVPGGALGSLANGTRTLVVGAARREPRDGPYVPSGYSAAAAADPRLAECNVRGVRRRAPDLFAMGQRVAAGFLSGSSKSLAGTSMAAAQVSAALATSAVPTAKGQARASNDLDRLSVLAGAPAPGSKEPFSPAPRLAGPDPRLAPFVLPALPCEAHHRAGKARDNRQRPASEHT